MLAAGHGPESPISPWQLSTSLCGACTGTSAEPELLSCLNAGISVLEISELSLAWVWLGLAESLSYYSWSGISLDQGKSKRPFGYDLPILEARRV